MVRVFVNALGDGGSISGWVIPKIQKMILDDTPPCLTLSNIMDGLRVSGAIQGKE